MRANQYISQNVVDVYCKCGYIRHCFFSLFSLHERQRASCRGIFPHFPSFFLSCVFKWVTSLNMEEVKTWGVAALLLSNLSPSVTICQTQRFGWPLKSVVTSTFFESSSLFSLLFWKPKFWQTSGKLPKSKKAFRFVKRREKGEYYFSCKKLEMWWGCGILT